MLIIKIKNDFFYFLLYPYHTSFSNIWPLHQALLCSFFLNTYPVLHDSHHTWLRWFHGKYSWKKNKVRLNEGNRYWKWCVLQLKQEVKKSFLGATSFKCCTQKLIFATWLFNMFWWQFNYSTILLLPPKHVDEKTFQFSNVISK